MKENMEMKERDGNEMIEKKKRRIWRNFNRKRRRRQRNKNKRKMTSGNADGDKK